jgi:hypothetical protein
MYPFQLATVGYQLHDGVSWTLRLRYEQLVDSSEGNACQVIES